MIVALHNTQARNSKLKDLGYDEIFIEVKRAPIAADFYALLVMTALLPTAYAAWAVMTVLLAPCAVAARVYLALLPDDLDRFDGWGFALYKTLIFPLAALALAVGALHFWFVLICSHLLSLPVGLFRIVFMCQWGVIANNFRLIKPTLRFCPIAYDETVRACTALIVRVGLVDALIGTPFLGGYASAATVIPIAKFVAICNPWLFELEEAFVTQWGPMPRPDMPVDEFWQSSRDVLGQAKWSRDDAKSERIVHKWFTAVYAYGEGKGAPGEEVVGIQHLNA